MPLHTAPLFRGCLSSCLLGMAASGSEERRSGGWGVGGGGDGRGNGRPAGQNKTAFLIGHFFVTTGLPHSTNT